MFMVLETSSIRPDHRWTCSRATSRRPASKRSTRRFGGYDTTLKSTDWAQPPPGPALRLADHRAAIHLGGRRQRYLLGSRGREDIVVRGELLRRHARVEADLHLLPERVEAVALDGIDHAYERRPAGKLPLTRIAHVDRVDRSVAGEVRRLAAWRQLLEVDGEERTVIEGGHRSC